MVAGVEMSEAADAEDMEAEDSLSAEQLEELNCLAPLNLFIKEDGSPMDFYMRKSRFDGRPDKLELSVKLESLVSEVQKYGASLSYEPCSPHSIEIAFPDLFTSEEEIDFDVFDAKYISECIEEEGLLDLEKFRIGKSPYDGGVNMTDILKGIKSWDDVKRPNAPQGRKLPNFAPVERTMRLKRETSPRKKKRAEYSTKEDTEILKYVLKKELHRRVGGNRVWQIVSKAFPHHSYQSLQNRFRRTILPNLDNYTALTEGERELFRRPASSDDEPTTSQTASSDAKVALSSTSCDDSDATPRGSRKRKSEQLEEEEGEAEECERISAVVTDGNDSEAETVVLSPKWAERSPRRCAASSEESEGETVEAMSEADSSCDPGPSTSAKAFKLAEDRLILEFIIKRDLFQEAATPGHQALWREIQDHVLKEYDRNAEAIEKRFRTHLLGHLEQRAFHLNEDVICKFRSAVPASSDCEPDDVEEHMEEVQIVEDEQTAESEGKGKRLKVRTRQAKEETKEGAVSDADSIQISSQSTSEESELEHKRPRRMARIRKVHRGVSGAGGRLYSHEEDKKIIDYIVKSERYAEVRGKTLWVDIENKVLHKYQRTWESAKNRFLKTIMKDLTNRRYGLDAATVQKFRHGFTVERHMGGARREKRGKPAEEPQIHPALVAKSSKSPVTPQKRRVLYKQPGLPVPVLFTPASVSATRKPVKKPASVNLKKDLEKGQEPDEVLETTPTAPGRIKPLPIVLRKEQPRILDHLEDEIVIAGTSAISSFGKTLQKSPAGSRRKQAISEWGREGTVASQSEGEMSSQESTVSAEMIPQPTRQLRVVLHRLLPEQLIQHGCVLPESTEREAAKARAPMASPVRLRSPAKTPCPTTPHQQLGSKSTLSNDAASPMLWFSADIFNDFGHAPTPGSVSKKTPSPHAQLVMTRTPTPPSPSRVTHTPSPSMARRSLMDLKASKGTLAITEQSGEPGVTVMEESDEELDRVSQIAVTGSFETEEIGIEKLGLKINGPSTNSTQPEENSCESDIFFTPSEENSAK